jgi:hypothetical protein
MARRLQPVLANLTLLGLSLLVALAAAELVLRSCPGSCRRRPGFA